MENLNLNEYLPEGAEYEALRPASKTVVLEMALRDRMGLRLNLGDAAPKLPVRRQVQLMEETLTLGEAHPGLPVLGTASEDDITYD